MVAQNNLNMFSKLFPAIQEPFHIQDHGDYFALNKDERKQKIFTYNHDNNTDESFRGLHHYENLLMQYTEIFIAIKMKIFSSKSLIFFLIFAQNIDCGYTLEPLDEAVLTRTHNLCFGA